MQLMRHMKIITTTSLAVVALLASACGDEEGSSDPLSCDWGSERLMSSTTPEQPTGQQGPLAEALVGKWQHTHIIDPSGDVESLSDTTDIRYMFSESEMAFCQHITGVVEVGPSQNVATYTLEGDVIELGAASYTAVSWNQTSMVWINDRPGTGERYILQRRD